MAEDICEIWYGLDAGFNAEFFLEEKGWIKASRYFWDMHLDDYNEYRLWEMTYSQYEALYDWCVFYGIKFPEKVIAIKE